jgi:hypothetical protein
MSEGAVENVQGPTSGTDNGQTEPQEHAAPWAQYTQELPDSVRPLVEPVFQKWDADVTKRFQKYSQDLEPFKAWQPVIEQYGDPQVAQQAFALMEAINTDPEKVYQALAEQFGFGDQGGTEPEDEDAPYVDPEFQTVKQMTEQMAQIMLQQEEAARAAEEDAALESHLAELKEKYGEYDEEYVLAHLNLGYTGEQAVEKFQQMMGTVRQKLTGPSAPVLLGSGGGLPSQSIDPAQLNSKDTKSLVAQMLAAQANQT